jgi:hypothetical protein
MLERFYSGVTAVLQRWERFKPLDSSFQFYQQRWRTVSTPFQHHSNTVPTPPNTIPTPSNDHFNTQFYQ